MARKSVMRNTGTGNHTGTKRLSVSADDMNFKSARRKINKNEFLSAVAKRSGLSVSVVKAVYVAFVEEIKNVVCHGYDLSLTGFGSFVLKKHKGHPVQFEAKTDAVKDYVVLKFAASDVIMTEIRRDYEKNNPSSDGAVPDDET